MNQRPPPGTPVFDPELGFEVVTVPSRWCFSHHHNGTIDESTKCAYFKEGADCPGHHCSTTSHAGPIIYLKKETYLALRILGTL